jgi:poly-gamma-glutamate synthesis protein (capsule biosynthesis protein)
LIASGDTVAHDSVNANADTGNGYDYYRLMDKMAPVFKAADIRFCNQSTLAGGEQFGISGYPTFNAPVELTRDMAKVGCNLVNTASNHSFDKSQATIDGAVAAWEKQKGMLAVAGQNRSAAEQNKVATFNIKGVKFAFLAYTTYVNTSRPAQNNYGVNRYSREFATQQIAAAKKGGADFIIVSMRWGDEYSSLVNTYQESEARFLAGQGARIILGHGPHVLQPVRKIEGSGGKDTLVWFSLGNFLNTQLEKEALFNGLAVVDIDKRTLKFTNTAYLPIASTYSWSKADAKSENLLARRNVEVYLLEDLSQQLIDANQLDTTADDQLNRITDTLNAYTDVTLIDASEYYK